MKTRAAIRVAGASLAAVALLLLVFVILLGGFVVATGTPMAIGLPGYGLTLEPTNIPPSTIMTTDMVVGRTFSSASSVRACRFRTDLDVTVAVLRVLVVEC